MNMSTRILAIAAVAAGAIVSIPAQADEGPFEMRLRAVYLSASNNSDAFAPLSIPQNGIHINSKWLPDVDLEWFFTPNWSSELVLTYPQKQTVTVTSVVLPGTTAAVGPVDIGTFKHLPPVLTVKYNFMPGETFRPYLGVGVNLTLISNVDLNVPTVGKLTLDSSSVGPAAQAGFDVKVADHWLVNADLKWAMIRSDVKFNGTKISQARIDPLLFGIGVGYRF